jgi:hypothetical protein
MQTVYSAFRDYIPRPYAGRLTLFRANARPLLSGYPPDLGWGRFVNAVEIRQISGNHSTILHPPHVGDLTRQLSELLLQSVPGTNGRVTLNSQVGLPDAESPEPRSFLGFDNHRNRKSG